MTVLLSVVGNEKNQNVMQIYFDAWNLTDKSSAFSLSPFSSFFLFLSIQTLVPIYSMKVCML